MPLRWKDSYRNILAVINRVIAILLYVIQRNSEEATFMFFFLRIFRSPTTYFSSIEQLSFLLASFRKTSQTRQLQARKVFQSSLKSKSFSQVYSVALRINQINPINRLDSLKKNLRNKKFGWILKHAEYLLIEFWYWKNRKLIYRWLQYFEGGNYWGKLVG